MTKELLQDLVKYTKKLMINDIFYGLFLSTIEKRSTTEQESKQIPLAAVGLNKSTQEFTLIINEKEWFKLAEQVKYGVLLHEVRHLTSFHLLMNDSYPNSKMANIAMDCEINQTINKDHLPTWGIFIDDLEQKYPKLDWKRMAGSMHYYKELGKLSNEEKAEIGIDEKAEHHWIIEDGDGNPVDIDSLSDAEKNSIRSQIESTIEALAEEISKNNGNIPVEIDQLIKGFVKPKPKFNYNKYIRNYVGNSTRYKVATSRLKENQRFPGSPKVVLRPKSRILVLIDESGSVSETELFDFLNEIYHLQKQYDIEIRPFDTEVGEIIRYSGKNEMKRAKCGGTSFTAAVDYYNSSIYNSCLIFTDGFAETPPPCFKRLLWVISSNGNPNSIKNHVGGPQWIKIPRNEEV
jgi:predicted metal-dependent peptidase